MEFPFAIHRFSSFLAVVRNGGCLLFWMTCRFENERFPFLIFERMNDFNSGSLRTYTKIKTDL